MGSLRIDGISFQVYPQDHKPLHVHVTVGGYEVIVMLLGGRFRLREFSWAKKSDIRRVLRIANENADALIKLWEINHD